MTEEASGDSAEMQCIKQQKTCVWWFLFPLRVVFMIVVGIFDSVLSRYLVAVILVGLIWGPLHLLWGISVNYFTWPTLIFGILLTGLWEGCSIFTIRNWVPRWMMLRDD